MPKLQKHHAPEAAEADASGGEAKVQLVSLVHAHCDHDHEHDQRGLRQQCELGVQPPQPAGIARNDSGQGQRQHGERSLPVLLHDLRVSRLLKIDVGSDEARLLGPAQVVHVCVHWMHRRQIPRAARRRSLLIVVKVHSAACVALVVVLRIQTGGIAIHRLLHGVGRIKRRRRRIRGELDRWRPPIRSRRPPIRRPTDGCSIGAPRINTSVAATIVAFEGAASRGAHGAAIRGAHGVCVLGSGPLLELACGRGLQAAPEQGPHRVQRVTGGIT
mmetsp:Transcript_20272/g.58791  ORF Transcript_20272/g.58791 Transcript_20272/m.58791 type:complete len:273 (-) Transcript_20272:1137-1955(-)